MNINICSYQSTIFVCVFSRSCSYRTNTNANESEKRKVALRVQSIYLIIIIIIFYVFMYVLLKVVHMISALSSVRCAQTHTHSRNVQGRE